tara:strand:+ start:5195 stop:5515 length:321 start_codon:yes stop_codon:yes gene_type:complete
MVQVIFITPDGISHAIQAEIGETLMQAAVRHRIEGIEAACGGSMVCGTCHAYLDEETFGALGPANSAEQDMLDFGVQVEPTSRLCCQIEVTAALDGAFIRVPESQG